MTISKETLLKELMKRIPDSIYFKNRECQFILVSKAKADEVGMTPEQLVGKTDFDFFPKEQAQKMYDDEKRIMETGEPILFQEEKITTPSGEVKWVSASKMPMRDENGNVIGTLGISRYITKQKKAEMEVQFERGLLHSLLDYIPDAIVFKDKDSVYVRVNKAKATELGVSIEEATGKTDYDFYPEEIAREMVADDKKVMENKEPIINKTQKVTKPDGQQRQVFVTKIPRYDGSGNVIGTLSLSRDITEHWVIWKRMQEIGMV